jgi:DHA1 family tetracycline resistance protein-like MFS transporter
MTDTAAKPAPRRAATLFLVGTVGIDAMAFAIIMPVLPALLMELTGGGIGVAAFWGGWATFAFALMQFFCSPVIGGLSDRFGRRPVLLLSLTALAIDFLLMGLAHALYVFFIARLLSGIFAATHSTANAYIADISTPQERAKRYGWLGAAMGAGFILGPALGGVLGDLDARAPFFAAAALAGINALYGWFVVPESLKQREPPRVFLETVQPVRHALAPAPDRRPGRHGHRLYRHGPGRLRLSGGLDLCGHREV